MPSYLSVCILSYLFWSYHPFAYEVLMDGKGKKKKDFSSLKDRRREPRESQTPLRENSCSSSPTPSYPLSLGDPSPTPPGSRMYHRVALGKVLLQA